MKKRKLRVESLERRLLLAGDVAVSVKNGDLLITGDKWDNSIEVVQVGSGAYEVIGVDDTTVKGEESYVASGVTRDIIIKMNNGNDSVLVSDVEVPRNLRIEMGSGADDVAVGSLPWLASDNGTAEGTVIIAKELTILTGNGEDNIWVASTSVGSNLKIDSGNENDNIFVGTGFFEVSEIETAQTNGGYYGYVEVQGNAHINAGSGDDNVAVGFLPFLFDTTASLSDNGQAESSVLIGKDLTILTSSGEDNVLVISASVGNNLKIETGSHDDNIGVGIGYDQLPEPEGENGGYGYYGAVYVAADATVNSGSGDDNVAIGRFEGLPGSRALAPEGENGYYYGGLSVGDDFELLTGDGEDWVSLFDIDVYDNMTVNTGAHNDELEAEDIDVGNKVTLSMGSGHDTASIDYLYARSAKVDMGSGDDSLYLYDVYVELLAELYGGPGYDRLEATNYSAGTLKLSGWEELYD